VNRFTNHSSASRRHFLNLTLGALGSTACSQTGPPPKNRPNVIVVLSDDQAYGDFSSQGNSEIHTPDLDRFRSEAVRFTDFHSSPMCTPTRAQLMTGRDALYTQATNVSSGRTLLRRDLPTLAEAFANTGYKTGIFGKWHLGDTYHYRPEDRGFQETVWFPSSHIGSVPDVWNNDYFNDSYRHNGEIKRYQGYSTDVFFDQAMQWMRSRQTAREPFFCYLPLNAAHIPLRVENKYSDLYPDLPPDVARYYGMISNIDRNMGRLDRMLTGTGLRNNTIVFYISDNGGTGATMRYKADMRGTKASLYEGGHRVPCFVRWPTGGIGGGRDIHELAEMQDVYPTLTELCGLTSLPGFQADGTSLAALMQGRVKSLPERTLVVQFSRMNVDAPQQNDAAVMSGKWRWIQNKELYDIASDPEQKHNLFSERRDIADRLKQHYDRWWASVEAKTKEFLPVYLGTHAENPTLVSSCEWAGVFLDQSSQVRLGERKNGTWHVYVENAGDYRIALRRWPRPLNVPLSNGLPVHHGELGDFPTGVALPIKNARLQIGGFDYTVKVSDRDCEAVFEVRLPAGPFTMKSWFLDGAQQELLGAYYAYVYRVGALKIGYAAAMA
jgi:arylsulfatase A-like enzyme